MLLLVDIGNTNVKFAIERDERLVARWRVATNRASMPDDWWIVLNTLAMAEGIDLHAVNGAALSSSVPAVTPWIATMIQERLNLNPLVIDQSTDLGISVQIDNPREVGPDRLVDAAAAFATYGGPVVVLDFGSATTLNVVTRGGAFVGGAIAPDVRAAHDALVGKAARLSSIDLVVPASVIGHNTVTAMQAGIVLGYIGLINGLIERIDAELGEQPAVVATGGIGQLFLGHVPRIAAYEPDLTLHGLRLAWRRYDER